MSGSAGPLPGGVTAEQPIVNDNRPNVIKRVLQGDLPSVRVLAVLALIWIIFQSQNDRFLSAGNLTNLMLQIAGLGIIATAVVMVLLLGEIDLSGGIAMGGYTLTLFVRNAFDERGRAFTYAQCTTSVCGGNPYYIPTQPRTIGLRFTQDF